MKKYKLIKKYPFCEYELDIIISVIEYWYEEVDLMDITKGEQEYSLYPEFWQEVKEPLFVTKDGKEIYDENEILFKIVNVGTSFISWVNYIPEKNLYSSEYVIFSTKESAEQWIKENKPRFSEKQVLDAMNRLCIYGSKETNTKILKKELGL